MKKLFGYIVMFACIGLFLAGAIGLIIPFDFEDFSYGNITSSSEWPTSTYQVSFDINYKGTKTFEDVEIEIEYRTKLPGFFSYEDDETEIEHFNFVQGTNTITFTHTSESYSSSISDITSVKLTLKDGTSFELSNYPFFSGINWVFISLCIAGFFSGAILFAVYQYNKKKHAEDVIVKKNFNDRIKEAFSPVADTINTLRKTFEDSKNRVNNEGTEKVTKVTCPYCKGKYNSNEDRCPHCGAPPEPSN